MIFHYQKPRKVIEVLNDLVRINNDRIAGYQLALESPGIEPNLQDTIRNIIQEGLKNKQQLIHNIKRMDGGIAKGTTFPGKICKVWMDLKIKFAVSTRKAVIASCQYNEEIALHVYNAALNETEMDTELRAIIEQQEAELRQTISLFKSCREARHIMYTNLSYFN